MRVLVVYESLFGNTSQIAAAVAEGIRLAAPDATVVATPVDAADPEVDCDLLVVGGPTHFWGMTSGRSRGLKRQFVADGTPRRHLRWPRAASAGVREWLDRLADGTASNRAAAFDTRMTTPLPGGAAKRIAKRLRQKGYRLVTDPEGFLVASVSGPPCDGEVSRATQWGAGLLRDAVERTAATEAGRRELWGAASGFAVLAVSAGAVAFERGGPSPTASAAELAAFFAAHRDTLIAQSVLFVAGEGILLWFLGSLRTFLRRAEGGAGRLSTLAYGAGLAGAVVNLVAQAFQVGLALGSGEDIPPALFATTSAAFAIANLPLAVMLSAVAVISLRDDAFPAWLGWLSAAAATASAVLAASMAVRSGPLAAGGWLNTALYSAFVVWLIPTTTVMVRRIGRRTSGAAARQTAVSPA